METPENNRGNKDTPDTQANPQPEKVSSSRGPSDEKQNENQVGQRRRSIANLHRTNRVGCIFFWVIAITLCAIFIGCIILTIVFKDKIWPSGDKPPAGLSGIRWEENDLRRANNMLSNEELLAKARKELGSGHIDNARGCLDELLHRRGVHRPLSDWIRLNRALVEIVDSQLTSANDIFNDEKDLPPLISVGDNEALSELSQFFENIANQLGSQRPLQPVSASTVTPLFGKPDYNAFGLVLAGMKDWELEAVDEAAKIFDVFQSLKFEGDNEWLKDYEPLIAPRLHDYALYFSIRDKLRNTKASYQDELALLEELNKSRSQLQIRSGKILELFNLLEATINARIVKANPSATISINGSKINSNLASTDDAKWHAARDIALTAMHDYRFPEAVAELKGFHLDNPDFEEAKTRLQDRAQHLTEFVDQLIADINLLGGYPKNVTTREHQDYKGGIKWAANHQVTLLTDSNTQVNQKWTLIDPEMILKMAIYFADKTDNKAEAARRRWLAAYFAQEFDFTEEMKALAKQAAKDRPEYKSELYSEFGVK